jgi:hypothetical protein
VADEAAIEFQSYLLFVRHFCQLIRAGRAGPDELDRLVLAISTDQAPRIAHLQQRQLGADDLREVRKYVFTAWNSEAVARLSALLDADIRQFTNQWKPVQVYYAIYFHLVTMHFVVNGKVLKRHEPTLRWATQSILLWFPLPWSLRVDYDSGTLHKFPPGTTMRGSSGWNLRNNEPYFHVANFFRRTAQRNQREDWREHYKGNKKRRIPSGLRKGRMYRVTDVPTDPVSIFDVMWRFRRWANYLEADTIIEGGEFEPHAVEFDGCFNEIMETTATVFENVLCRYLGRAALHALYEEFIALARGRLDTAAVERRRDVICGVVA